MKREVSEQDYISSVIKNYLISEVAARKQDNPKWKETISLLFAVEKKPIDSACNVIYEQRDSISNETLFNFLDRNVYILCDKFDRIKSNSGFDYKFKDYLEVSIITSRLNISEKLKTEMNSYFLEEQNKILSIYKNVAISLGIKDTLNLSNYFTYLLWNGYFSITGEHIYKLKDRLITDLYGIEVFQGKGVCVNYSSLLQSFLELCNKNAQVVICNVDKNKINRKDEDKPKIERKFDIKVSDHFKHVLLSPIKLGRQDIGNHAITMIYGEKGPYYYDATNIFVLNPKGRDNSTLINGEGTMPLKLNSYFFLPTSPFIKRNIIDLVVRNKSFDTYTKPEVKESLDEIIKLLDSNKELLAEAYFEARPHMENICEKIDENKEDFKFSGIVKKLIKEIKDKR